MSSKTASTIATPVAVIRKRPPAERKAVAMSRFERVPTMLRCAFTIEPSMVGQSASCAVLNIAVGEQAVA